MNEQRTIDCGIIIRFPNGAHTTEISLDFINIDVGQMVLARENLAQYIESTYKELRSVRSQGKQLVVPRVIPKS